MALLCALLEHSLESRFLPDLKSLVWISHVGLVLMVAGELIRKAAILTATTNFTHDIKEHRRDNHELVTSGVYRQYFSPPLLSLTHKLTSQVS